MTNQLVSEELVACQTPRHDLGVIIHQQKKPRTKLVANEFHRWFRPRMFLSRCGAEVNIVSPRLAIEVAEE